MREREWMGKEKEAVGVPRVVVLEAVKNFEEQELIYERIDENGNPIGARDSNTGELAGVADRGEVIKGADTGVGGAPGRSALAQGSGSQRGGASGDRAWDAEGPRTDHELWVGREVERFIARKQEKVVSQKGGRGVEIPLEV
jgi:hypothetical protein